MTYTRHIVHLRHWRSKTIGNSCKQKVGLCNVIQEWVYAMSYRNGSKGTCNIKRHSLLQIGSKKEYK